MPIAATNDSFACQLIELEETDSSNNYAMAEVKKGMAWHGKAYFAHRQTAGKGRRGKAWLSEPKQNIILSVVLNTSWLPVSAQFQLMTAAAISVHFFFNKYATDAATIKWPNDIYWNDRKAGGILIENVIRGKNWQWAVVGIGLNINQTQFEPSLNNPVSLKQITGKNYDVIQLTKELCECLSQQYRQLEQYGFAKLLAYYNEFLYKKNKTVKLKNNNKVYSCIVKEVNVSGDLITSCPEETVFNVDHTQWLCG